MTRPTPALLAPHEPLARLCGDVLVTTEELSAHWRMAAGHLGNLRRAGRGVPYIKLPTGAVRYRLADVLAAEVVNTHGDITLDRIELAISALRRIPAETRNEIVEHLKAFFAKG